MGLITPVELPSLDQLGRVHFIAIGGSGMNGIASMMLAQGIRVSGSDRQDSKYLRSLEAQGARVYVGHRAEQLGDASTVVASSAIREDNPELVEARRRGLRVLHRSAALGSLMLGRRGIAVAGTHGKTTTTAMIAHVLVGCGADPSFVIGGALTGTATGGHLGSGDAMIVEADESDGSFLQYPCEVAVVTNIDPDHLSNWGSAENYADGFLRFATADSVRLLVTSADDPGALALTRRVRQRIAAGSPAPEIMTFGTSDEADVQIKGTRLAGTGSTFELRWAGHAGPVELVVPGHYNVLNAAAAYAVASLAGPRRGRRTARVDQVPGHVPAVPADWYSQQHPRLRRLRSPPHRGVEHVDRSSHRRRCRSRRGLLSTPPLHPHSRLLARARTRSGAGR